MQAVEAFFARQALAHCLESLEGAVRAIWASKDKVHDVEGIDLGAVEASGAVDGVCGSQVRAVLASRAAEALRLAFVWLVGACRALNGCRSVDAIRASRAEAASFSWERRREHGLRSTRALKTVAA